jgi:hypothetical protein
MTVERCAARQESDQMRCSACGLIWDANDPEPPPCRQLKRIEAPPLAPVAAQGWVVGFVSGLPNR